MHLQHDSSVVFSLTSAVLMAFAVLLAWPSEGIHRLHQLQLPRDTASPQGLLSALRSRLSHRRLQGERSHQVIDAFSSLEAELQSGQAPAVALVRAAGVPPAWPSALAAVRIGGDVSAGLRADAQAQPILGQLAACWEVAAHTGSGLAQSVAMLAESARTREELEATLNAELAGPRATARVLAMLPIVGILLGVSLGADPVAWLTGSAVGRLCAFGGLAFTIAGWSWANLFVRKVERQL